MISAGSVTVADGETAWPFRTPTDRTTATTAATNDVRDIAYAVSMTSSNSTDAVADSGFPVSVTGRTSVREVISGSFA